MCIRDSNNTCAICGNRILNIDDAAVDHIKQYWTGGKTIPENARLAHRFCNNARPRIEKNTNEQDLERKQTGISFKEGDSIEENETKNQQVVSKLMTRFTK